MQSHAIELVSLIIRSAAIRGGYASTAAPPIFATFNDRSEIVLVSGKKKSGERVLRCYVGFGN